MEDRMKFSKRLNVELIRILIITMLSVGLLMLIGSTIVDNRQITRFHNDKSIEIAQMVSDQMDGDFIERLSESIDNEAFREIQKEAFKTENEQMLIDWLVANQLYEEYAKVDELFHIVQKDMDISYLYMQIIKDGYSVYLFDSLSGCMSLGYEEELSEEFSDLKGNERLEPTISRTKLGWLSSAGESVVTSKGEKCAVVYVDIDVTESFKKTSRFSAFMFAICLIAVVLAGVIVLKKIKRRISHPIEQLTAAVETFGNGEDGYDKSKIMELDIHTGNEIEKLYHSARAMQESLIDYMDNLTRVTAEKERIGAELDVATKIQESALPNIFPAYPECGEFDLYASMDAAKEVGGDFYDFFKIDEDHLGLVVADVSGKGVPAALFMIASKIMIKNHASITMEPAEVLTQVNNQLCEGNEAEMFVTVWFAVLEISTGKIKAANAGHEYPAICRKGGEFELFKDKHDFVLAGMEGYEYSQYDMQLQPGDRLFLYTDGVPEATNADNELFGTERMLEWLNKDKDATPEQLAKKVREGVDLFVKDAPQFDDLTMLAITYWG